MRTRALASWIVATSSVACSPAASPSPPAAPRAIPAMAARAAAPSSGGPTPSASPGEPARAAEEIKHVHDMLRRVAASRGLPIRREVASKVLDRDAILERIKRHVEKDVPLDVVATQGEALAALELVPADYDLVAGVFRLVGAQIAGFYEPEDQTMYLVDDQGDAALEETLAHELDHALQDQSFPLAPLLKFDPGASDRTSAVHALIEGDAVSAMLDVEIGSALKVSESALAKLFAVSTALTEVGATTPHVLQDELVSPYVDGFALVEALRRRGGWAAVDAIWQKPPETTEQLLHVDKLDAREPAIAIAVPPIDALGAGWTAALDDSMGEQGLRLIFDVWASGPTAKAAAAGWGGDRYVVARRDASPGRREIAFAWHLRMDTRADADEVAALLTERMGKSCRSRADLGPIAWKRKARDLVVVAGPYAREGNRAVGPAATCAQASTLIDAILAKP